jgi:hypothetical protein
MAHKSKAEVQHYVPRVILKNFVFKNRHVYVFDKLHSNEFSTEIKNIMSESNFYNKPDQNDKNTPELHLSILESKVSKPIQQLIEKENLTCLSEDDKSWIAAFMLAQLSRTKGNRTMINQIHDDLLSSILSQINEDIELPKLSPEDIQSLSLENMLTHLNFIDMLLQYDWCLIRTTNENPFLIGDDPVVRDWEETNSFYGGGGLTSKGLQLFLPLSSNLILEIMCPTVRSKYKDDLEKTKQLLNILNPTILLGNISEIRRNSLIKDRDKVISLLKSLENLLTETIAMVAPLELVKRLNAMQVRNAERFIVSKNNNFNLAKEMIEKDCNYKNPPKKVKIG